MRGKIIASAVVALGLLSSPVFATSFDLGELDPTTFDSASLTGKLPNGGGHLGDVAFTETYSFTLTTTGLVSPGIIITSAAGPSRLPDKTDVEFCVGGTAPADCMPSVPLVSNGSTASVTLATIKELRGAGSPTYYLVSQDRVKETCRSAEPYRRRRLSGTCDLGDDGDRVCGPWLRGVPPQREGSWGARDLIAGRS